MVRYLVCLVLALIAARPAFGWGCTGHQTIAPVVREQLAKAGTRLAVLLNEIWK